MTALSTDALIRVLPPVRVEHMANGLTVGLVHNAQAPVVTTALLYRVGSRDDPAEHAGAAHFLEHMMFKGTPEYAAGEIDRTTRRLGGTNNALTGHDATLYYFAFAADRWQTALEIEASRMRGLNLIPTEVDSERQVIEEEIAMYEDEPWDALEEAVLAALHRDHPYGLPVIGNRGALARTDATALRAFHSVWYRPSNAVLVLAGDLDPNALSLVEHAFGDLGGPAPARAVTPIDPGPTGIVRVERHHGEVARMLLALPAPAASASDQAVLRLVLAVLGAGRASRLHRALVDEGQLCSWVSCEVQETVDAGAATIALETLPGVEPERVEAAVLDGLAALATTPPTAEEIARARRILLADWVMAHERVHQQAMLACYALGLFDLGQPERYWRRLLDAERRDLDEITERYLQPERGAVIGWSLPRSAR